MGLGGNKLGTDKVKRKQLSINIQTLSCSTCTPPAVLFSNSFLRDLDAIGELRRWISDPTKPLLPPNFAKRQMN